MTTFLSVQVVVFVLAVVISSDHGVLANGPTITPSNLRSTDEPTSSLFDQTTINNIGGNSSDKSKSSRSCTSQGSKERRWRKNNEDNASQVLQCTSSCQGGITRRVAVNCLVPDLSFPPSFDLSSALVKENDLSFRRSSTSNVCPDVVAFCKAQDSNLQNKVYAASFCNPMRTRCASGPVSCNQAFSICSSSGATWCAKFLNNLCREVVPSPPVPAPTRQELPSISPRPSMSPHPTNIPTVTTAPSSRPTVFKLKCGKTLNEWIDFINAIYPTCALATVKSQADLNYYASQDTQSSPLLVGMVKDSDSSAYQCQSERNAAMESDMKDSCLADCYEGWRNVADNSRVKPDPHYWAEGQPDGQGQGNELIATVAGLNGDGKPWLYDESEVTTFDYAMMECCLDLGEQQLCQAQESSTDGGGGGGNNDSLPPAVESPSVPAPTVPTSPSASPVPTPPSAPPVA
ncbi:hypothetical protein ACA910_000674 [Epithemia clementina (nom. ined.)]